MICATHEGTIKILKKQIRCEKLGWIITHKHNIPIGENVKYYNPKISFDGDYFWFSISAEYNVINNNLKIKKTEPIGIDLGLKTLAVCSNGIICNKPNIVKEKKKLKKIQKHVAKYYNNIINNPNQMITKSDNIIKSKNLLKLESKIRKIYKRINNKLNTNIHEFTKSIIKLNPQAIIIEDLDINKMLKNKYLSEQIHEAKFFEFRRQLEYKCKWNNINLIIADRWYPSSKICSNCGHKKTKLSLSERTYICENCGNIIDRDLNAAINLKKLAI